MSYTPFRVEFLACAPVQMDYMPTHLDGLISWALLQEKQAEFTLGKTSVAPDPLDLAGEVYSGLPLKMQGDVYCASVILPQEILGNSARYFTRSSDTKALGDIAIDDDHTGKGLILNQSRMRKISTARGELKTYLMQEQLIHSPLFLAYGIGDIDRVQELLSEHVFGLGKNRAKGFGSISNIKVIEDDDANEFWKMRALPHLEDGYIPVVTPVRPPYWNKSIARIAYMPKDVL